MNVFFSLHRLLVVWIHSNHPEREKKEGEEEEEAGESAMSSKNFNLWRIVPAAHETSDSLILWRLKPVHQLNSISFSRFVEGGKLVKIDENSWNQCCYSEEARYFVFIYNEMNLMLYANSLQKRQIQSNRITLWLRQVYFWFLADARLGSTLMCTLLVYFALPRLFFCLPFLPELFSAPNEHCVSCVCPCLLA